MMAMDCAPIVHVAAIHAAEGYNGNTPGIGALCELGGGVRAVVGTYRNSNERQSNYAAVVVQPLAIGPVRVGVLAGAVTGYRLAAMPMGALALSVPVGKVELHATVVPNVPGLSPATMMLSGSFRF